MALPFRTAFRKSRLSTRSARRHRKRLPAVVRPARRLSLPVPMGRHTSSAAAPVRANLRLPAAEDAARLYRQGIAQRSEFLLLLGCGEHARRLCRAAAHLRPRQLLIIVLPSAGGARLRWRAAR